MKITQLVVVGILCLSLSVSGLAASETGFKVKYDGGSIANLKAGTDLRIDPAGTTVTLTKGKEDVIDLNPGGFDN